jgi:hypothetical protein
MKHATTLSPRTSSCRSQEQRSLKKRMLRGPGGTLRLVTAAASQHQPMANVSPHTGQAVVRTGHQDNAPPLPLVFHENRAK